MPPLVHLPAADRVARPWKNGGGVTRDVASEPPGADFDGFDWRISIADIAGDGPFSLFPGIDRSISVLSGVGMYLDVGGRLQRLTPRSMPFRFAGEATAAARLRDGPVRDFNVMSRRGRIDHRVIRLGDGDGRAAEITAPLALALWVDGPGRLATPAGEIALAPLDAVLCRQAGRWQAPAGAVAYLVSLGPTG